MQDPQSPDAARSIAERGLELHEDVRFQEVTWTVQRVGWIAMALIAVATLLGLFSGGPLSRASAGSASTGLTIEYDRFLRLGSPALVRLGLHGGETDGREVVVRIAQAYVEDAGLEQMHPAPAQAVAGSGGLVLVFRTEPGRPAAVVLSIKPRAVGQLRGEIGLADRAPIRFRQFVYP